MLLLVITDVFGNSEALTDFQGVEVIEEVNGDYSLSFTCFLTEKNKHSFPLVQEESIVELEGLEFRIKKMTEMKNRKQVIAQHIFFETIDNQVYEIRGGSLSLDSAAAFALSGSGWSFENVDITESKLISNFGEGNTVSLTNQICTEFSCERKIEPGRRLKFKKEIGEDNDQQFRYKYNIKTLKRTVDTTRFCTVLKGYGADGLVVEYRSPNIAIYGERHGEPIRDERFTNPENLLEKCKKEIQDVPEVSIEVELSQLGFDAQLGDKIWLIYEPLNLEFQTRIMSVKSWPFLKRSPVVELSNRKQTFTSMLAQTKIELKEAKKETRSKIEQTNEKITLEVERIDESIATLQIDADNIVLNVQSLDSRLGTAEGQLSVQAGLIQSKVSQTDFNGNTIMSLIEQTPTEIKLAAERIRMEGITHVSGNLEIGKNWMSGEKAIIFNAGGSIRYNDGFIYQASTFGHTFRGDVTIDSGYNLNLSGVNVTGLDVTVAFG
jgi:phage minor structural protein